MGGFVKMSTEELVVALNNAITSKDNRGIVDILTKVSHFRRLEIIESYRMQRGNADLTFPFKMKPNFVRVLRSLIIPLPTFLAQELHNAIKNGVRDAILEILCGISTSLLRFTTSQYELMYERPESTRWVRFVDNYPSDEVDFTGTPSSELVYGRSLEYNLLEMDAEENFKSFCVSISLASRSAEHAKVDSELVSSDARALFNAAGGRYWWSDDEDGSCEAVELAVWIAVWTQRSYKHLLQVFDAYKDLTKTSIEEAIKKQFIGDVKIGFLTMAKCIKDTAAFYAERLHYSMNGVGTDNDTLIRVVVTNADVGFSDIKNVFKKKYGGTLEKWIAGDTSGDYKYILLSLIGTKKSNKASELTASTK